MLVYYYVYLLYVIKLTCYGKYSSTKSNNTPTVHTYTQHGIVMKDVVYTLLVLRKRRAEYNESTTQTYVAICN